MGSSKSSGAYGPPCVDGGGTGSDAGSTRITGLTTHVKLTLGSKDTIQP